MKALFIALSAATLVAGCASTSQDNMPVADALDPMSPLSAPGYMSMAASSDLFEIESSRLALQMSRNPAVQGFAQQMINDHSRTSSEMQALARNLGMTPPPPVMMPHHREALDRLRAAAPADFDRAYKAEQLTAHQEALNLHSNYASQGDTPELRAFASRVVPAIQMHYQHAQGLPDTMAMPPQQEYQQQPVRSGERG